MNSSIVLTELIFGTFLGHYFQEKSQQIIREYEKQHRKTVDIQRFQLLSFLPKTSNGPYLVLVLKITPASATADCVSFQRNTVTVMTPKMTFLNPMQNSLISLLLLRIKWIGWFSNTTDRRRNPQKKKNKQKNEKH